MLASTADSQVHWHMNARWQQHGSESSSALSTTVESCQRQHTDHSSARHAGMQQQQYAKPTTNTHESYCKQTMSTVAQNVKPPVSIDAESSLD